MAKSTTTTEKRLIKDIQTAREAFENCEICNGGWIRTEENAADGLTKQKKYNALERMLESGLIQKNRTLNKKRWRSR